MDPLWSQAHICPWDPQNLEPLDLGTFGPWDPWTSGPLNLWTLGPLGPLPTQKSFMGGIIATSSPDLLEI